MSGSASALHHQARRWPTFLRFVICCLLPISPAIELIAPNFPKSSHSRGTTIWPDATKKARGHPSLHCRSRTDTNAVFALVNRADTHLPSRLCLARGNLQFNASLGVDGVVAPERVVVEGEEVVVPGVISGQFTGVPHALDGEGRGGTASGRRRSAADRQGQQAQQESLIGVVVACARRHYICYAGFAGCLLFALRKIPDRIRQRQEMNVDRTEGCHNRW